MSRRHLRLVFVTGLFAMLAVVPRGRAEDAAGATPQAAAHAFMAAANKGDIAAIKAAATPNADEETLRVWAEMLKAKYAFRDALEKKFGLKAIQDYRKVSEGYAYQLVTPEEELDGVKNGTVKTGNGRTIVQKKGQPGQGVSVVQVNGERKADLTGTPEQLAKANKRNKEKTERFKKRTKELPADTSKDIAEFFNKPGQG